MTSMTFLILCFWPSFLFNAIIYLKGRNKNRNGIGEGDEEEDEEEEQDRASSYLLV